MWHWIVVGLCQQQLLFCLDDSGTVSTTIALDKISNLFYTIHMAAIHMQDAYLPILNRHKDIQP